MECMQTKALRPSLCGELAQNEFVDEIFYNTATHTAVSCVSSEDSLVDEFLDLQNVEFEEKREEEEDEEGNGKCSLSFDHENSNLSCAFSESQLASELAVPDDDIAGLEWVSHFVDDSFSEFPLYNSINNQIRPPNRVEPAPIRTKPVFAPSYSSIPVKPRTKRSRPATTRPSPLSPLSESSSSSSSSSSPSSFGVSPSLQLAIPAPERKKPRRKSPAAVQAGPMFQRRCSHCQVQKTPQWRTGPLGAKTLCNACGVRFKSGRLFPEYRPACSPTFSSDVHSNSHRKVVEMRKKKEVIGSGSGSESGFNHIISSF